MITRRSFTFLVIALALLAPATAQADKAKPKSSGPKILITLTDGAVNNKIRPTVLTTFAPPKGTTAATACKGKITASAPLGKKIVKKKKKTIYVTKKSSIKNVGGVCTASSVLKLPAAFLGKSLKFTATFKGNDAVKKFSKSTKFLLVVPPPPPPLFVPTSGAWIIQQLPGGAGSQDWTFTMGAAGEVASIKRITSLPVTCTGGNSFYLSSFPTETAPFDTPFQITAADVTASDHFQETPTGGSTSSDAVSTFTLHFDAAGHAMGTFRLTGSLVSHAAAGASTTIYSGCDSGVIPIELKPGSFA